VSSALARHRSRLALPGAANVDSFPKVPKLRLAEARRCHQTLFLFVNAGRRHIRPAPAQEANTMREPRLKAGPLHLAAIVLMHFACMSLIVSLSL